MLPLRKHLLPSLPLPFPPRRLHQLPLPLPLPPHPPPLPVPDKLLTGIELILTERHRTVKDEGFGQESDDAYLNGELARAAYCYEWSARTG